MAYDDAPVAANIYGSAFRPAYQFDTMAGSAGIEVSGFSATLVGGTPAAAVHAPSDSFALTNVTWMSVGILSATVPSGLPSGQYDLVVGDPRAHSARLPRAFTSLGIEQDLNEPRTGK